MKKTSMILFLAVSLCLYGTVSFAKEKTNGASGKELFKQHCSACHPDGGNIINQKKTLHKKDLDSNNIKKPGDIMRIMRNPGPGMTKFDEKAVADRDAKKIAEYILKTFK